MSNWLYNDKGEVRPELYMQDKAELDELQKKLSCPKDRLREVYKVEIPKALDELKSGDTVYVKPDLHIAKKFGGRMIFIAIDGLSNGPCMFCRTDDGGGGFIGQDSLVDKNNPKLEEHK